MSTDERIDRIFEEHDDDKDGYLSQEELVDSLKSAGIDISGVDIPEKTDYEEYITLIRQSFASVLYDEIDSKKTGLVSYTQMYKLLKSVGGTISQNDLINIITTIFPFQKNANPSLTKEEFLTFFTKFPITYFKIPLYSLNNSVKIRDVLEGYFDMGVPTVVPTSYSYSFIAGAVSGLISRCITAPLDVIRINVQISGAEPIKTVFSDILLRDGIKGLYAGNLTNCLKVIPFNGCVTWSYAIYLKLFGVKDGQSNLPVRLLCGGLSGLTATLVTYPMDLIRSRLALQGRNRMYYDGMINAIKTIKMEEGFKGLYKGLLPSLLSVGMFVSIQQSFQDLLRYKTFEIWEPSFPKLLCCGLISGICAQMITYPFDLIRRNMQLSHPAFLESQYQEINIPSKFMKLVKYIYKEAGWKGFYHGLGVTTLKVVPAVGLGLALRDFILGRMNYYSPCIRINYKVNNKDYYLVRQNNQK